MHFMKRETNFIVNDIVNFVCCVVKVVFFVVVEAAEYKILCLVSLTGAARGKKNVQKY